MTTPNTVNATNTTMSNMEAATTIPESQRYFGAASGFLFVVIWIASLLLPNRLAPVGVPFPNPITSTSEQILSYYAHAQTAGLVASMLQLLSTLPLLGFTAYVVVVVRRAVGSASILPWLTFGGGILAAGFLALSSLLTWVLTQPGTVERSDLVRAFYEFIFITGGTAHVALLAVFTGAASIAAWQTRFLPNWIVWVGFVAAGIALLSLVTIVWLPASVFILAGRILVFVWALAVSFTALRKSQQA